MGQTDGSTRRGDKGAAAVEFALLFPIVMVIIFGIIGFGIVFTQMQSLSNAARDAARAGVVTYPTPIYCSSLITQAIRDADTIGIDSTMLTVTVWLNYPIATAPECKKVRSGSITGTKTGVTGASNTPCYGATDSDPTSQLTVVIEYPTSIELLFTKFNPTIKGRGTFRCEYTT